MTDELTTVTDVTIPTLQSKPVTDLSPRVVELARAIDQLPPGTFEITIQKGEVRAQDWHVEIVRTEKIQNLRLPKHPPG